MSRLSNMNPFGPAALLGVGGLQGGVEDEEAKLLRLKAQQAAAPQQAGPPQAGQPAGPGALMQALDALAPGSRKETAGGYPADGATEKPGGFNPDFFSTVTTGSGQQSYPWFNKPGGPQQIGAPSFTPSGEPVNPIAPYLSAITGTGYGQSPMQMDPQVRMAAMGMMNTDADRAQRGRTAEMQFGSGGYNQQKLDLDRQSLAQHATLAREQMQNQRDMEERKLSPEVMTKSFGGALATRAATDPSFDADRIPFFLSQFNNTMNSLGMGGNKPLPPLGTPYQAGEGRGSGAVAPQSGQPAAAAPAIPAAPSPMQLADRAVNQLRPLFGQVGMGPGGKMGEMFTPSKPEEITPQKMIDAVNRLQGIDLNDPAAQTEFTRRIQRGDIGDPTTLRKLLAQQMGGDYLLANPPPRDQGGALPASYSIPGLFEMREQKPGTFFGDLARRAGRGLNADSLPYNKIVLPSGEAIDFNPRESGAGMRVPNPVANLVELAGGGEDPVAATINSRKSKAEDAKRRLPSSQALLRALMGQAGAPAGK
jgi:hypothetical protein